MKTIAFLFLQITLFNLNFSFGQESRIGGAIAIDPEDYELIPEGSAPGMGALPSSFDLSEWFPEPGDQGTFQGSCVAWAIGYGLKGYQEARERNIKPTSSTGNYSPSYIYNQIKLNTYSCNGGSSMYDALNLLKEQGVSTLQEFPYYKNDCSAIPGSSIRSSASVNKIADFKRVAKDPITIKSEIASGIPVAILIRLTNEFNDLGYNQIYKAIGADEGNHGMIVVGYDDSRNAFKVLNSWGTQWGTNGYCWIDYSALQTKTLEAYTAQDITNNTNTQPLTNQSPNTPIETPQYNSSLSVSMNQPLITHNIWGNSPAGFVLGMNIVVPGTITNGINSNGQLVVRFYMPDGNPLIANQLEYTFKDMYGLCAAGTPVMPILTNSAEIGRQVLFIPYYALNLMPSNGMNLYYLAAVATFYINNFEVAKSDFTPFQVRY